MYQRPKGWQRFALNCAGKFDDGNDDWLDMKNGKN